MGVKWMLNEFKMEIKKPIAYKEKGNGFVLKQIVKKSLLCGCKCHCYDYVII